MKRPKKENLLDVVRELVEDGSYIVSIHAKERSVERDIIAIDYEHVLTRGWHEKRKDEFNDFYKSWDYSIRSQSTDERAIRVIVTFEEEDSLLVVTLIDLDKET